MTLLSQSIEIARRELHVSFLRRLGTYRSPDMEVTIRQVLGAAAEGKRVLRSGRQWPAFHDDPPSRQSAPE